MAKKQQIVEEPIVENISVESLDGVMGDRYAIYAKYVIQDRAIPDVRDGLKPVQRRIIYSMYQNGITHEKQTKKCAKIVGDVMGRFHPHGDTSIYDALVRLSQHWKMSMPLIAFQGNNGSIDNDPAAAYRYTEAKLNEFSKTLITDIDKNTVDMTLNFDDTEFEPVVLPCRYPNLFVNGSEGIAVAIATEIPPHNLVEMCEAAIYYIQHKNCSLDELLEIVKGPDFPTGGIIYNSEGIRDIYETGRGKIEIASKVEIDTSNKNYNELIITEIPYGVVKQNLVFSIDKYRKSRDIDGIVDVKDLSSGDDIKICVELKKDMDPNLILAFLMNKTQLRVSYSSNIVAICDKHPRQLNLLSYLDYYTQHQVDVIKRRSEFILKKDKDRLHIVEGLIKATSIINEIVAIIRKSKDKADSKQNIIKAYGFSEAQAEAIVTMRLYKLSNTDVQIYLNEKEALEKEICELEEILNNDSKLKKVIVNDLKQIIKTYGVPRRTTIEEKREEIQLDKRDLVAKEDVYVVVTKDGYIKRSSIRSYNSSNGSLPGVKANDLIVMAQLVNTTDYILAFTNKGNYIILPVHEILDGKWKDEGKHINYMCNLPIQESIIKCIVVKSFDVPVTICTVSTKGQIKKSLLSNFYSQRTSKPVACMRLIKDDTLADVCVLNGDSNIFIATKAGRNTYFNENALDAQGMRTSGVKCISNLQKSEIACMLPYRPNEKGRFILITDKGFYKICDPEKLNLTDRLGKQDDILKSFKTKPHTLRFGAKLVSRSSEFGITCLNQKGEVEEFKISDLSLTPREKFCATNIENFDDINEIIALYNFNAEVIDENTPVDKAPVVKTASTSKVSTEESDNSYASFRTEDNKKVRIVTIDGEDDYDDSDVNYEQISIFDDMGD